jgi:hypothetical protein
MTRTGENPLRGLDYDSSPDIIVRMTRTGEHPLRGLDYDSSPDVRMTEPIHPCIFFECETFEKAKEKAIELGFTLEKFNSMIKDAGYDINWEASKVQYYEDLEAGKYHYQEDCQDECQEDSQEDCQENCQEDCQENCQDLVLDDCQNQCQNKGEDQYMENEFIASILVS